MGALMIRIGFSGVEVCNETWGAVIGSLNPKP